MPKCVIAASMFVLVSAASAFANDSSAELGGGGLLLTHSDGIELTSEDLFISMDEVRVDYVFTNRGEAAVETIVAFPMPDLSGGIDNNVSVPDELSDNFLGFTTVMDGKEIEPQLDQRAVVAGIDVTDELVAQGVPLLPGGEATQAALAALPAEIVADWLTRGIVADDTYDDGSGWKTVHVANWTLRSAYWWRAVFPAGRSVAVSHRYHPSVGMTAGLNYLSYDGKPGGAYPEYARKYCADNAFLNASIRAEKTHDYVQEKRIDYVLTSGGNWANGTIGRFRLTVDKGSPANLVSFCGTGVRKTGPTTFEMTAEDFYPEKDIHILFAVPMPAQ
ncbi:MAG: DUF4424 domain-containing protein [Nitratireductor sp.]|nr:DUF4424 domain-containing protein [Nitratireductor sp.]